MLKVCLIQDPTTTEFPYARLPHCVCPKISGIDLNKEWLDASDFMEFGSPIHGEFRFTWPTNKREFVASLCCSAPLSCDVASLWERQHVGSTILPNPSIQDWSVQRCAIIDKATGGWSSWGRSTVVFMVLLLATTWLHQAMLDSPCSWLLFASHDSQYPPCLSMMNPFELVFAMITVTTIYNHQASFTTCQLSFVAILDHLSSIIGNHAKHHHGCNSCDSSHWLLSIILTHEACLVNAPY